MCGTYSIVVTEEELMIRFMIEGPGGRFRMPRYIVKPGDDALVIISDGQKNRLGQMPRGLIPHWEKDDKVGFANISARCETLHEKPAFREAFKKGRCLIPTNGYFEYKPLSKDLNQPYRCMLLDGALFAMAAIYDTWVASDGRKVNTFAVVTTVSNSLVSTINDRMPVILKPEEEQKWLDPKTSPENLKTLLKSYEADKMRVYPVSMKLGSLKENDPKCIEKSEFEMGTLF